MAIYHVDVAAVQRSAGRSATAGAAYVTGQRIVDERTGRINDYTRRKGVDAVGTVGWHRSIDELWNTAEQTEKHPRGITARTSIIALPAELDGKSRISCLEEISAQIRNRWSVAVTWAAHAPSDDGDDRNHHGHVQWTSRVVTDDGIFGAKTRQLDDIRTSRGEITWFRGMVAETINRHLADDGLDARVDHRSLRSRWLAGEISEAETVRAVHLGPSASAMERAGLETDVGASNRAVAEIRAVARQLREVEDQVALEARDPLNRALAAPSPRTSNEHAANLNTGRARVAAATADLARPSPAFEPFSVAITGAGRPGRSGSRLAVGRDRVAAAAGLLSVPVFEPLAVALAGPAQPCRNSSRLTVGRDRVADAAAGIREGADRREGSLRGPSLGGNLGRAEPGSTGRAEPGRPAVRTDGRAGPGDRPATDRLRGPGRAAPPRDQSSGRAIARSASAEAAAAALRARPSPEGSAGALPLSTPLPSPVATSAAGADAAAQRQAGRRGSLARSLRRLRRRVAAWALRALDVVAGRQRPPERLPDGLEGRGYAAGLRLGQSNPAAVSDPGRCRLAADRLARDLVDAHRPSSQVVVPLAGQSARLPASRSDRSK